MWYNEEKCRIGESDMSQKKVNVANFNVVFLEEKDEAPLLKYFDSIVVPAFQSGIKKDNKDAELFFMNVEVVEDSEGEYVLVGYVVKKTVLEVKSDVDEKGNLIEKDEKYPSAPYFPKIPYSGFPEFSCRPDLPNWYKTSKQANLYVFL